MSCILLFEKEKTNHRHMKIFNRFQQADKSLASMNVFSNENKIMQKSGENLKKFIVELWVRTEAFVQFWLCHLICGELDCVIAY